MTFKITPNQEVKLRRESVIMGTTMNDTARTIMLRALLEGEVFAGSQNIAVGGTD